MTKMRSLSVSRNPLERLQEIEAAMSPGAAASPIANGNLANDLTPNVARTHAPTHARDNERTNGHASVPEGVEKAALTQLLSTPLEVDLKKGPFQAATVRMPAEVWKRVGWVASFSGRTKQEVIGEALITYLDRLRKNPLR
jgi:hypothetical protein